MLHPKSAGSYEAIHTDIIDNLLLPSRECQCVYPIPNPLEHGTIGTGTAGWDGAGVRVGHVPASYRDIKYVLADALLNDRDGGFHCSVDVMYSCRRWHVLGSTSYARNTLTQNGTGFLLLMLLLLLLHIIPPTPRHVRMKPTAVEQLYSTLPATATASQ